MTEPTYTALDAPVRACTVPFVSLLLAVRNEAAQLPACLGAIANQDYPASRVELIIADGGSTDGSPGLIEDYAADQPFHTRRVENRTGGTAAGFNAALRVASGDIIIILGARALLDHDFISKSVTALERSGADGVGGVVVGEGTSGLQAGAVAAALGSRFGVGGARYRFASVPGEVDTVNYGAYRRRVFTEIGGFDEALQNVEDDELNYRLRAAGGRLFLSPDIRCHYQVRPSLSGLAKQFIRYGYPKLRVLRRHPRQMQLRQFAPAALVTALLLLTLTSPRSAHARVLLALLAGSYLAATGAAASVTARRTHWRYLPLLPFAFAGMHLGYGAASLAGAIRFGLFPFLIGRGDPSRIPSLPPRDGCSGTAG